MVNHIVLWKCATACVYLRTQRVKVAHRHNNFSVNNRARRTGDASSPAMVTSVAAHAARSFLRAGEVSGALKSSSLAPSLFALCGSRYCTDPLSSGASRHLGACWGTQASQWSPSCDRRHFSALPSDREGREGTDESRQRQGDVGTSGEWGAGAGQAAQSSKGWVTTLLPPAAQPYAKLMRLDAPIGTWLLLWPGYWCAREPYLHNL